MAQWIFYGKVYSTEYKDAFRITQDDASTMALLNGCYRVMMAGAFAPKNIIKRIQLGKDNNPLQINEQIEYLLKKIYGANWKYLLDMDMPVDEFKKDNTRILLMPHAEYYLTHAFNDPNINKKEKQKISDLIDTIKNSNVEDYDTTYKEVLSEHEKDKEKQLYFQMLRTGAIKERCKPNIGAYNDNVIGNVAHRIIVLGIPAREVIDKISDSSGLSIDFIREQANRVLVSGIESFDYGARNECYLALKAYNDNYDEKVKGLAWAANTTEKKLLRSFKGAKRELLKKKRMFFVYSPMFYMPAEETQFSKKRRYTHGRIKSDKVEFTPAKKIRRVPQIEKRFSRSSITKFFKRIKTFILSLAVAVGVIVEAIKKHWQILIPIGIISLFMDGPISSKIWWTSLWGILAILLLFFLVTGYNDICIKNDLYRNKLYKRVRAAVLGMDPGVSVYTIDMLRKKAIPEKEYVIIKGDAYIENGYACIFVFDPNDRFIKDRQNKKSLAYIFNNKQSLRELHVEDGLKHITMLCYVRYSNDEIILKGNPRKSIYVEKSVPQGMTEAQKKAFENLYAAFGVQK